MNTRIPLLTLAVLSVILLASCLGRPSMSSAQLIVVDERVFVTELRPDVNKIGIAAGETRTTRNWIKIESRSRASGRGRTLYGHRIFSTLRPGTWIRVHGGRDFDQNIVAREIWF